MKIGPNKMKKLETLTETALKSAQECDVISHSEKVQHEDGVYKLVILDGKYRRSYLLTISELFVGLSREYDIEDKLSTPEAITYAERVGSFISKCYNSRISDFFHDFYSLRLNKFLEK